MTELTKKLINCRPALGCLVRVSLQTEEESLVELAFEEIARAEATFTRFDSDSECRRYRAGDACSENFGDLLEKAGHLKRVSEGAFQFWREDGLDFGGIAKGYAIDLAIRGVLQKDPSARGVIEAGGDLRFFGKTDRRVDLRLGAPPSVYSRSIIAIKDAVATSAPGTAARFGPTSSRYATTLYSEGTTIVAMAEEAWLADGATKVALFAKPSVVQSFCATENVDILVFDKDGEVREMFGR